MTETSNEEHREEERYEVDSEWLKQRLTSLEEGFSKIADLLSKQSEQRSHSEEPQEKPQEKPSEIEVKQVVQEDKNQSQQTNRPRSRLVIRGPKMLRR